MARKSVRSAKRRSDGSALPTTIKVTLRLDTELVQRLGVESAMRRVSQSAIVEEVLGPHLKRWRLPNTLQDDASGAGKGRGSTPDRHPIDGDV